MLGGAMTGLIQQQVQTQVTQLQQGIREVRLTITWPDGNKEDSFTVTTHMVVLNPTGTGISTGTPVPPGQGSSSSSSATGTNPSTLSGAGAPAVQGGLSTPTTVMH
jgi:pantoate kinase